MSTAIYPNIKHHPLAKLHCPHCDGHGYVLVESFDLVTCEVSVETEICQCVLQAVGDGE